MTVTKKIIISMLILSFSVFLFLTQGRKVPYLDAQADKYFSNTIAKATLAYATTRAINAGVSVIKDSDINAEPGGLGISVAVGKVLDPIDDMTERLSNTLVIALTSLGLQKLIYEISIYLAPKLIIPLLIFLSIFIWVKNRHVRYFVILSSKIVLIIIVSRFCLPVSSLANNYIYNNYFSVKIDDAKNNLEILNKSSSNLANFNTTSQNSGFFSSVIDTVSSVKEKVVQVAVNLKNFTENASNIISNLLKLTFLYVGIFVVQVIILPILSFLFLKKTLDSFFINIEQKEIIK